MSVSSDSSFDMNEPGEMNDRDVERLIRGRIPVPEEAPKLAGFLADFDATYPEPSIDHCEAGHLSAIFAAAQQLAEADQPLARPTGENPRSGQRTRGLGDERRDWMARRLPRWLGVKLAIPIAILLFAFGGVAVAGGLVYHQATSADSPPEVTQPGSSDTTLDPIGQDDSEEAEDAFIEGTDQDGADDLEDEQFDADDADNADDLDDGHDPDAADIDDDADGAETDSGDSDTDFRDAHGFPRRR